MIDGRNFFDQLITTGQGGNFKTSSLLHYLYLKGQCKMIAIDLSKQEARDANLKAMQQIRFA